MAAAPIVSSIITNKIAELQKQAWTALHHKDKVLANVYEKGISFLFRHQEQLEKITELPDWRRNPDCLGAIIGLALLDYTAPTGMEFWKRWVRKNELVETGKALTQSLRNAKELPASLGPIIRALDIFYRDVKTANAESQCRANLRVALSLYNVHRFHALLFFIGVRTEEGGSDEAEMRASPCSIDYSVGEDVRSR